MRTDVHASALRAAAKVALSVAILEGCGGATTPVDTKGVEPVTAGGDTTTPAPGASGSGSASGSRPVTPAPAGTTTNPSCDAVINAAFPSDGQYPGTKQLVSAEVQSCCVALLGKSDAPGIHRWDCCANLPENAPASVNIACTPWGPPVPPSMKRRVKLEVA